MSPELLSIGMGVRLSTSVFLIDRKSAATAEAGSNASVATAATKAALITSIFPAGVSQVFKKGNT
jgi:hypothetical protein